MTPGLKVKSSKATKEAKANKVEKPKRKAKSPPKGKSKRKRKEEDDDADKATVDTAVSGASTVICRHDNLFGKHINTC